MQIHKVHTLCSSSTCNNFMHNNSLIEIVAQTKIFKSMCSFFFGLLFWIFLK